MADAKFARTAFNLGYLAEDPTRCVGAVIGQNLGLGSSWILGDAFRAYSFAVTRGALELTDTFSPRLLSSFRSVLPLSHCASASAPLHSPSRSYTNESRPP